MQQIDAPVAYAVIAGPDNWATVFRFANGLLRSGERVLVVAEGNGQLEPGTFVIPLARSFDPWVSGELAAGDLRRAAADSGLELRPLDGRMRIIAAPAGAVRVGLYGGGGAPFNHAAILATCGFGVTFLSDADIRAGRLQEVDVFLMPGGGERAMFGQLEPLGEEGCRAIADFVRGGGMYIGCCAGSYDCIVNSDEFLSVCPAQRCLQLINAGPWKGENAVGFLGLQSPGVGVVTVRNERPDHPVMFGMPQQFDIVHYNGPVLDPLPQRPVEGGSAATGLASFNGWTERFTPAEQFAGEAPGETPTYLAQAIAAERFSIAAGELGRGRVVAFGSHPEFGFDLPMVEWTQPARMFVNAVLWQAVSREGAGNRPATSQPIRVSLPAGSVLDEVVAAADGVVGQARTLQARSIDPAPSWLAPAYSMSVFGLPPDEIWRQSLTAIVDLAGETSRRASDLKQRISLSGDLTDETLLQALQQVDQWVLDERPAEWRQDGGYQGIRALLRTAERMCDSALAQWDAKLGPPGGPYDYFAENPYHQVAGSYLAAVGYTGGALQLMRALQAVWMMAEHLANGQRQVAGRV